MKLISSSILIFLLLTQIFSRWLVVVDFTINREFIAKVLCINKEKPKLKCAGKCQLMKKMAQEENKDSKSSVPANTNVAEVIFTMNEATDFDVFDQTFLRTYVSFYPLKKYPPPLVSIFHPPSIA